MLNNPTIANAKDLDATAHAIITSAIRVHRAMGPGLLESTYEACLAYELAAIGLKVARQVAMPVHYREVVLDCGYRLDLLVEDSVVVEVKSVEQLMPVHQAQIMSYLRLSGLQLGLLINFNVPLLKQGIKRIVNNFREEKSQRNSSLGALGDFGGEN